MRGVPVLASDSGYHPRSGMLPLARSPRRSNLPPSNCGNNARNSMATTDDFSLLDRALSNCLQRLEEELLPG